MYPQQRMQLQYASGKNSPVPVGAVIGLFIIFITIGIFALTLNIPILIIGIIIGFLAMLSIRIAAEWERAVILRLGKYSRIVGPGLFLVIPVFETTFKVDLRVRVWDVQPQEIMSSDSVPVEVDAVVYYQIVDPKKAILNVEDFAVASVKLAQTTLRDIVGKSDLDRLLMQKEEIGKDIQIILDNATDPWGIKVISVEIKDVVLPEMLKRAMAKEAEASREKKARIIKASAEFEAATKFGQASEIMTKNPSAMQLRQLQTWQEIGAEQNSLMILIPTDFAKSSGQLGVVGLGNEILKQIPKKFVKKTRK